MLAPPQLIKSITTDTPPSPSDGDRYIVPIGATGAFASHDNELATFSTVWSFQNPVESWFAYIDDEDAYYLYNGTVWAPINEAAPPALHAASHGAAQADAVSVEALATSGAIGQVPTSNGAGGLTMETPAGGGGGNTITSGSASASLSISPAQVFAFTLIQETASFDISTNGNSVEAASITAEVGFTVTDPSEIISGTPTFVTAGATRGVEIVAGAGSGSATVEWTWNGVPFSVSVVKF